MDFNKFEKCDTTSGIRDQFKVRLSKHDRTLTIPAIVATTAGFTVGDRVDLYKCDDIFALKKCSVGCLLCKSSSKSTGTIRIRSLQMFLEIAPYVKADNALLYTWVEGSIIYFSTKERPNED